MNLPAMGTELVLFWVFAVCTVASACIVIVARNPINSAMALVGTFFFLAGIYVLLMAHTIAVLQVLVYAGAIMVLFLFVIMLLSLGDVSLGSNRISAWKVLGGAGAAALLLALVVAIERTELGQAPSPDLAFGSIKRVGAILYSTYLLPFEAVSLLLLVAIVGAVVVAKSRI